MERALVLLVTLFLLEAHYSHGLVVHKEPIKAPQQLASHEVKAIKSVIHHLGGEVKANSTTGASNVSRAADTSKLRAVDTSKLRLKATATPSHSGNSERVPSAHSSALALYYQKVNPVLVRPSAGKGPDTVSFGLIMMNFYGADMKKFTFATDMVMSLKWTDPRVIELIPAGADKLSMAWEQALSRIWMPGIVVTNRDIEKYEIISASVTIFKSGEVLRVERAQARIMKKYALKDYPFDKQHLQIKIASSKYMLNEVVLVPEANASQCEENIFGLYDFRDFSVKAYEERDGYLQKSRGMLDVFVKRSLEKYFQDHLVPTAIVLLISCAVFYFPFGVNPFITPRLALSILSLLTFTNLMVKSTKELPGSAPFNWNDLINQQVQSLMFIVIIVNISSEIFFHQFEFHDLARWVNNEAKVLIPFISFANIATIMGSAHYGWMTLEEATTLTKALVGGMFGSYCLWVGWGIYSNHFKTDKDENQDAAAASEGEDDADADADCGCD